MGSHWLRRYAVRTGYHADTRQCRQSYGDRLIHLKIIPDGKLNNEKVEQLSQALCIYKSPLERIENKHLTPQHFFSFETVLEKEKTSFYVATSEELKDIAKKAIESSWPRVTVEETEDPLNTMPIKTSTLDLEYHYMFALKVDRRQISLLESQLETLNMMRNDEQIYIQILGVPAEHDWYISASEAYKKFKSGSMPTKFRLDKKSVAKTSIKVSAAIALEARSITSHLVGGGEPEKIDLDGAERAQILRDGNLRRETLSKTRADAYISTIRVGVVTDNEVRAKALMRMITMAFRELDGDNHLVAQASKVDKTWRKMKERKLGKILGRDYLSIPEFSRLTLLPTYPLQEKYKIPSIGMETDVNQVLLKGGLKFGDITYKGKTQPVYIPTNNIDELCLPRIVIGSMGSGKTKGYGANFMVEAVNNGFGAVSIDPAKGEIGDEVEKVLPPEKVVRIRLGDVPISLDWREVERSRKAKNRLANTIIGFFNSTDMEAGAQTSRYLRAAVMGMKTGKLSEILSIFEDVEYLQTIINDMPDSIHKTTLQSFSSESDARKRQILSPIYNRLDVILGDEYLNECMKSDDGIDMVDVLEQRKAFIIDVPKPELGPEAVDLIVNLLSTKIDLAMTLRKEENQHPFFVLFDEPHQFLKSARIWKGAAVESRKWRVGYVWMFHSWEQIPRSLSEIIKAAGPHYHLYPSSKKTFQDLTEEIASFTVEDALMLKRFHAINIIRADGGIQKPFIARMTPPPSEKYKR